MAQKELSPSDYTVAWICTLRIELDAATGLLDEKHPALSLDLLDTNSYSLGRLGEHNVVIVSLENGWIGPISAATTVIHMIRSFRNLKLGVLVGVGGGVPSKSVDMRLGDVVVSLPHGPHGEYPAVVTWDVGKAMPGNRFVRTGTNSKPPGILVEAAKSLSSSKLGHTDRFDTFLSTLIQRSKKFAYPGSEFDELYVADYPHVTGSNSCENCDKAKLVERKPREGHWVQIFYGTIASGSVVMRNAIMRDQISQELGGLLCFEMEAAGVVQTFPCLVIRGICDFSDSHKNDIWQPYAAASAAAYTKELLYSIPPTSIASGDGIE